jgi:hypothetical protein
VDNQLFMSVSDKNKYSYTQQKISYKVPTGIKQDGTFRNSRATLGFAGLPPPFLARF